MPKANSDTTSLESVRSSLSNIWFGGGGLLFVVLIVQSVLGKFGPDVPKVFAWFVPTVAPTLGLMLGVLGASALQKRDGRHVRTTFFRLARNLSLGYVSIVGLTILLEPFSPMPALDLLSLSNYWIAPTQGLAVAAMGYLFTSDSETPVKSGEQDSKTAVV